MFILFLDIIIAYFSISLILQVSQLTGTSMSGGLVLLIALPFVFTYYIIRHISAIICFRKAVLVRNINFAMIIFYVISFVLTFAYFNSNYTIPMILLIVVSFLVLQKPDYFTQKHP